MTITDVCNYISELQDEMGFTLEDNTEDSNTTYLYSLNYTNFGTMDLRIRMNGATSVVINAIYMSTRNKRISDGKMFALLNNKHLFNQVSEFIIELKIGGDQL